MRDKIIEIILNNKSEFISGEELSKKLGISRAAIWKHMKVLKEEGYNIENMLNKSKKDYAYSIFDVEKRPSEKVLSKMKQIDGVIRLRVL